MQKIRIVSYYDTRDFKGWNDSVASMKKVYSEIGRDKIEWTVFGGSNRPELDIPVKYAGKVFNEDLAKLYSNAHIVFMSSWYESFPLPPIEAMNCGTAVVTTRFGTEDYAYDKENSLVVPPCRPEVLADAIISLAQNSKFAEAIARKGFETGQTFTWDNATDKLEDILKQAVNDYAYKESFSDISKFANGNL
jgi:glycosyltransferase involved in cell wall biosynthesis